MKFVVLDVYSNSNYRTSKDTNGGFGTVNNYGDAIVPKILSKVKAHSSNWPPLSSIYSIAVLRDRGHEVIYVKEKENKHVFDYVDVDVCLLTSSIVCHETEIRIIKRLKKKGLKIGVIGSFASIIPEPYLDAGAFVISGEPEYFFLYYENLEELKKMSSVVSLNESVEKKIDDLPIPAWDMVLKNYNTSYRLLGGGAKFLPILASRGCPYKCNYYCTYPLQHGRKVSIRSPKNIVNEMDYWCEKFGVDFFVFRDPVFGINNDHTKKLCDEMCLSSNKFSFGIETHLKLLDSDIVLRMKDAGLKMVQVGVESVDDNVLAGSKRFTVDRDEQVRKIHYLEAIGVKVVCFYILGMPGDTYESCINTIQYAKRINSYAAQFSVFTPYPGTPSFNSFKKKILVDSYESFTQFDLVFEHDCLVAEQINELKNIAYTQYYTNPKWFLKYLLKRGDV